MAAEKKDNAPAKAGVMSAVKRSDSATAVAHERAKARDRWTWEDKVAVATKYMQLGNMRLVSELTEVPYQTILDWRKTEWWPQLCDEIKQIKRSKMGAKLEEVIELSVTEVMDRLQNGDFVLDRKTGEIVRKPVSMRDAAQVTNQLITRQIQMEELAERLTHRKESIKESLQMLAKEFAKFTKEQGKAKPVEVVDVQFTEVKE